MLRRIEQALRVLLVAALALAPLPALAGGLPSLPSNPNYSDASQIIGTINSLINQLNGNPLNSGGYAAQPNNSVSLGSFCQPAAGASPLTCNGQRGAAAFTGITVAATGTNQTIVITDSSITTTSLCTAQFNTAFTAGSAVVVATVTPTAGSLSIVIANAGATTNAVTTGTLGFNCYN